MSDSLHDDLNPPQREAVLYGNGALLVLAGAGSGKTRVITRRIAQLVTHREVPAWRILAVTFTNKAAREMRERLQLLLGPVASNLTVATFHSAAAMILRREIEHVPSMVNEPDVDALRLTRSFVICDDADQLQTVKRAVKDLKIDSGVMTPRDYLSRIDQHKNAAKLPHQVTVDEGDLRGQYALKVYHRYQRLLRAANAVDFGDLLLLVVDLFRSRAEVREKYRRRFEHVLVDEFQDTNPVQYHFLKLIAPPGSNLVVVGDDDQSIYRWRGAEVENILRFPEDYPGTRQVKLEQNYRSDQNILEAANAVISTIHEECRNAFGRIALKETSFNSLPREMKGGRPRRLRAKSTPWQMRVLLVIPRWQFSTGPTRKVVSWKKPFAWRKCPTPWSVEEVSMSAPKFETRPPTFA